MKTQNPTMMTKGDEKLLRMIRIATEIVLREDKELLEELAKH